MTSWADIQRGIFAGESGGDYNALFGYQNRPGRLFSDIVPTQMTIDEVLAFQNPSGPYGQYVGLQNKGVVATPVGAYQVVGTTLRDAKKGLGLRGDELFDQAMQDRIGRWIYDTQGTGAWEGYKGPQQSGGQQMPTMPQQQAPRGLLEYLGVQKRGAGPQGDLPFYQRDRFRDVAGRLAEGLNQMQLRPDPTMGQRMAASRMERKGNRTVDWLRSQPNGETYAQMIMAGADPAQVLAAYQGSMAGAEPTAMQRNYEFLLAQGYSPEKALQAVQGGSVTNISTGTIPPGYQLITDPETGAQRMEAIPGGPAAQEQADAAAAAKKAAELAGKGESTVARSVDFLIGALDKKGLFDFPEAGVVGNLLANLGANQEAVDFRNELASLQAVIAFDRLQEMRNASKTGGALGAVSETELTLLINAYGNLMQSTSTARLKENLRTIKRVMTKIENDPVAGAAYYGAATGGGASSGGFSVTGQVGQ